MPPNCISNFENVNLVSLSLGSQMHSVRFEMITLKPIDQELDSPS